MARVVSVGGTKEAALYFDQVLPFDAFAAALWKTDDLGIDTNSIYLPYDNKDLAIGVLRSLSPNIKSPGVEIYALLGLQAALEEIRRSDQPQSEELLANLGNLCRRLSALYNLELNPDMFQGENPRALVPISRVLRRELRRLGYSTDTVWGNHCAEETIDTDGEHRFELTLSGMRMIDLDKLSWEQVIEFRKDQASRRSLRDLRLFFSENFSGKPQSYVEDRLLSLADGHEDVMRLWKFETLQKCFSVSLSKDSGLLASVTSVAAVFAGAPLTVVGAAAAIFPVGTLALEFSRAIIDRSRSNIEQPTRFISHLRKLAAGRNGESAC